MFVFFFKSLIVYFHIGTRCTPTNWRLRASSRGLRTGCTPSSCTEARTQASRASRMKVESSASSRSVTVKLECPFCKAFSFHGYGVQGLGLRLELRSRIQGNKPRHIVVPREYMDCFPWTIVTRTLFMAGYRLLTRTLSGSRS